MSKTSDDGTAYTSVIDVYYLIKCLLTSLEVCETAVKCSGVEEVINTASARLCGASDNTEFEWSFGSFDLVVAFEEFPRCCRPGGCRCYRYEDVCDDVTAGDGSGVGCCVGVAGSRDGY